MFALTILYSILFLYIRLQLKNFRAVRSSTSDAQQSNHELSNWQANLEAGVASPSLTPKQIITTQTVSITTEERHTPRRSHPKSSDADRTHRKMNHAALTLLCYPVMYIALTITLCITRLAQFGNKDWGLGPVYAGAAIFECTGFVNVLLYTLTRRGIISWSWLKGRRNMSDAQRVESPIRSLRSPYPGKFVDVKPSRTLVTKPSEISITSQDIESVVRTPPAAPLSTEHSDSVPFSHIADDDKLVHAPGCPLNSRPQSPFRDSSGSTLVGTCSCHGPRTPRTPGTPPIASTP
jgi:hypothetical protein